MKNCMIMLVVISLTCTLGCRPNLVVRSAKISFTSKTVEVNVANIGEEDAGQHLTYIEINKVDAPDAVKPQSQYIAKVPGIDEGETWNSGPIPFSKFSTRGLDLNSLTKANLVVRADAKNMVIESKEDDNIYDQNQ